MRLEETLQGSSHVNFEEKGAITNIPLLPQPENLVQQPNRVTEGQIEGTCLRSQQLNQMDG